MINPHKKISYVVPCFNEEGNIIRLVQEIIKKHPSKYTLEIILVNDGSSDKTKSIIVDLAKNQPEVKYINFSRNFGHQFALKAGIDMSSGDCIISLDADLQHPPKLIPELIEKWEQNFLIVQAIRTEEKNISWFKKWSSKNFYRLINYLSDLNLKPGSSDYRLIDRKVANVITENFNEYQLFLRGIFSWVGFERIEINYEANERFSGTSKYSLSKMLKFAIDGITSFTVKPLRLAVILGSIILLFSSVYLIYSMLIYFFTDKNIQGWTSIIVTILLLGGTQLVFIGLIGEYLGKMFMETKKRPLYIVESTNLNYKGK